MADEHTPPPPQPPQPLPFHSVFVNGRLVFTIVTSSILVAGNWIIDIEERYVNNAAAGNGVIIGLDLEVDYTVHPPRVSTIHFSIGQDCLIFRKAPGRRRFPPIIRDFLADARFHFVGVDIMIVMDDLMNEGGFGGREIWWEELIQHTWAAHPELAANQDLGLIEIVDTVLPGFDVNLPDGVRDWNAPVLAYDDVVYACTMAYVACQIGMVLLH